jgi:diamine N-acetyltransferase
VLNWHRIVDMAEPAPKPKPTEDSTLALREITENNWRAVINLRTLPEQEGNLAGNAASLVESHYSEDAWVRAVYADDDTLVGFLMMAIWDPTEMYYIWRFMIDRRYQGLGFGRQGVQLAVLHIRETRPHAKLLRVMSTPPGGKGDVAPEHSPYMFYEKLGFTEINPADEDGEIEMALELNPS